MRGPGRIAAVAVTMATGCSPFIGPAPSADAGAGTDAGTDAVALLELEPFVTTALLTVPVTVGDSTLPFLFDTGGGGTLVTPSAAEWAGCQPFGRMTGFRHDGERVHAARCPPSRLVIDGWRAPARETGVFDLMALLPDGVPELGGIVALNTFDGLPITLDLGSRRVRVESPSSLRSQTARMSEVPFRTGRQSGGAMLDPFLAIRAPGGPLWFELDSGNGGPVYIAPHAVAQLGIDLAPDRARPTQLYLEGFGPVEVMAQEKEMIYDGLLNAELLRDLVLTFDLRTGRAWVRRASADATGG